MERKVWSPGPKNYQEILDERNHHLYLKTMHSHNSHSTKGTSNPTCKTTIIAGVKDHTKRTESVSRLPPQIRGEGRGFIQHGLSIYYPSKDIIHQLRNLRKTLPSVSLHWVILVWSHIDTAKMCTCIPITWEASAGRMGKGGNILK